MFSFSFLSPRTQCQALAVLLLPALTSCLGSSAPDTCSGTTRAPATALASTPRTGTAGTPVEVRYTVQIANGCGQFKQLEAQLQDKHLYLSPLVEYQGCACPAVVTDYNGIYRFTPAQAGKYVVHILKADNTQLTDTLTIQ